MWQHLSVRCVGILNLKTRCSTVHAFVPNHHGTDLSVRCMRPYDEYRQFTPNPEGGAHSNATLFDNRQQKKSESRELRAWKQSPLDSDHVLLILNMSLTWTDKSFVLVYPTSLIRHESKYSIEGQHGTQISSFGTYLGSGVTIRYDFGTTGKKNLLCLGSFHLFWTDSRANYNFFPLRCKNTNY